MKMYQAVIMTEPGVYIWRKYIIAKNAKRAKEMLEKETKANNSKLIYIFECGTDILNDNEMELM